MTYNRFLYNSALYNAGRAEVGAIARSIISAHTGPHIQAIVGSTSGVSFISDFTIIEGTVKKPPTQFKFPDLTAFIRAYKTQDPVVGGLSVVDLLTSIRGFGFGEMPACIFPSDHIPDLKGIIFGLFEASLMASIVGQLGQHDLAAIIQATVGNLAARMLGIAAPNLAGTIFVQEPGNLGARIHTPLDLGAIAIPIQSSDLLNAVLNSLQFLNLPGSMLGLAAPKLFAFIRAFTGDIFNLPAISSARDFASLSALLVSSIPGPDDVSAFIEATGGFGNVAAAIKSLTPAVGNLAALVKTGGELDLNAVIDFLGADNLQALMGVFDLGSNDLFLSAFLQSVHSSDLASTILLNENVSFLAASIFSLSDKADLGAFIRVSETFVTAILTVTTLASASLKAIIGNPICGGGSANAVLSAVAVAQHKGDLRASIESFMNSDLGASINSDDIFFALDLIEFKFTPFAVRNLDFKAFDTISFSFSPFRGRNLSAFINPVQNNVLLGASITVTFPLVRVVPSVNAVNITELRKGEPQNIQEIRLQLEGSLLEYIYVNGTEQSFIKDPNVGDWKINVRSFKPIAAGLFGDRAVSRICQLGRLESFPTLDHAVRSCIQAVIGLEDEQNLGAFLQVSGGFTELIGLLTVVDKFNNLGGIIGRVFPSDISAYISSGNSGFGPIKASITGIGSGTGLLGAAISQQSESNLSGDITGIV